MIDAIFTDERKKDFKHALDERPQRGKQTDQGERQRNPRPLVFGVVGNLAGISHQIAHIAYLVHQRNHREGGVKGNLPGAAQPKNAVSEIAGVAALILRNEIAAEGCVWGFGEEPQPRTKHIAFCGTHQCELPKCGLG